MTHTPPISAEQVEAAAEAMWRAEVAELGAARRAREAECWADQNENGKAKWRRFATAALTAAASIPASRGVETELVRDLQAIIGEWEEGLQEAIHSGWAKSQTEYGDDQSVPVGLLRKAVEALAASPAPQPVQEQEPVAITDAQGKEWFERTFDVPLGDMPGRLDVERVNAGLCSIVMRPASPPEQELTAKVERLEQALRQSMTALDDWLNDHASDFCDPMRVAEARDRIYHSGSVAYIADVQAVNRAALEPKP